MRSFTSSAWEVGESIRQAVNQLEKFPKLGRPGRIRETLKLVVPDSPHIVPYRIKAGEIQILSVYHSSRKWPEQFD